MQWNYAIYYMTIGLILITITDTIGAISSRKLNFNYAYLSIVSFIIFTGIGYITAKKYGLQTALIVNALLGIYDATIGFKLSIYFNANTGLDSDQNNNLLNLKTVLGMVVIACVFAYVGYLITKF